MKRYVLHANGFNLKKISLVILRILIGWHFLYEGLIKIFSSNWTAFGYLDNSNWIFSSFFHLLANNSVALMITDNLNAWGLVFIGCGLILGLLSRVASITGAVLLFMYYVANPPFLDNGFNYEGNYLFIDKNLVEMIALVVLSVYPTGKYFGIDRLLFSEKDTAVEAKDHQPKDNKKTNADLNCELGRRNLLKALGSIPLLAIFGVAFYRKIGLHGFEDVQLIKKTKIDPDAFTSPTQKTPNVSLAELTDRKMPMGEIKGVQMSRIILGGNLINGQAHARDLIYASPLLKSYFTDEKIIETWQVAESCGVNTMTSWPSKKFMRVYNEYIRRGGKIQWLGHTGAKLNQLKFCIDNGAIGIYIAGDNVESAFAENRMHELQDGVEFVKQNGVFAGIACHTIKVPIAFENHGIDVDFYMKTLHHDDYWSASPKDKREYDVRFGGEPGYKPQDPSSWHYYDNMWCIDADETIKFMKTIKKPWIGFKVLAAGAIHPEDGFKYAFENGADFIHVGIFDFQMVQNTNIVTKLLSENINREREWFA